MSTAHDLFQQIGLFLWAFNEYNIDYINLCFVDTYYILIAFQVVYHQSGLERADRTYFEMNLLYMLLAGYLKSDHLQENQLGTYS